MKWEANDVRRGTNISNMCPWKPLDPLVVCRVYSVKGRPWSPNKKCLNSVTLCHSIGSWLVENGLTRAYEFMDQDHPLRNNTSKTYPTINQASFWVWKNDVNKSHQPTRSHGSFGLPSLPSPMIVFAQVLPSTPNFLRLFFGAHWPTPPGYSQAEATVRQHLCYHLVVQSWDVKWDNIG